MNKTKLLPSKFHLLLLTLSMVFMSSHVMAKQYYKWVDQQGSTHYSATPPPKNAKQHSKIMTYGSQPATVTETAPAMDKKTAEDNSVSEQTIPVPSSPPQQDTSANETSMR